MPSNRRGRKGRRRMDDMNFVLNPNLAQALVAMEPRIGKSFARQGRDWILPPSPPAKWAGTVKGQLIGKLGEGGYGNLVERLRKAAS